MVKPKFIPADAREVELFAQELRRAMGDREMSKGEISRLVLSDEALRLAAAAPSLPHHTRTLIWARDKVHRAADGSLFALVRSRAKRWRIEPR